VINMTVLSRFTINAHRAAARGGNRGNREMDTPVIYRVTLEIELDEPLQDAEEKSAICAAIESIIEGDAFHEAMAGVDLHIGVAQVLALEPVRLRL
jgi:hypothetical protein